MEDRVKLCPKCGVIVEINHAYGKTTYNHTCSPITVPASFVEAVRELVSQCKRINDPMDPLMSHPGCSYAMHKKPFHDAVSAVEALLAKESAALMAAQGDG